MGNTKGVLTHAPFELEDRLPQEALAEFLAEVCPLPAVERPQCDAVEWVPLGQALGRVTAMPVQARRSVPHYLASAMDGVAVRAADTTAAAAERPVRLPVPLGAVPVDTGDAIPAGRDAVVMIERIGVLPEAGRDGHSGAVGDAVEITEPARPWQHIRPIGEDIVAGEVLLPAGHRLRPADLAALAGAGVSQLAVARRPRVAILPTGTELVPAETDALQPGQIPEFNSAAIAALVTEWGGLPEVQPITPDDLDLLQQRLRSAAERCDVLVVNAGSSGGSEDFTARAVEALGRVLVHGVAVRPGRPVILGQIASGSRPGRDVPVVGLPGYPVSMLLTAELFLLPLLSQWLGTAASARRRVRARLARAVKSPAGALEFLRVKLIHESPLQGAEAWKAVPFGRGAGAVTTLTRADGLVRIPPGVDGLAAGAEVDVELWRPLEEIEATVLCAGAADPRLEAPGQALRRAVPGAAVHVQPIGSLDGLQALARGEVHCAAVNLYDPESGAESDPAAWNRPFVERYLSGREVRLFHLGQRQQGIAVAPGNPFGIRGVAGLDRPGLRWVNRPEGTGARRLFELHLSRAGLDGTLLDGYRRAVSTASAVAAAIAAGTADAGWCTQEAAAAFGLDFVPVTVDRLDLVVPVEWVDAPPVRHLVELLESS